MLNLKAVRASLLMLAIFSAWPDPAVSGDPLDHPASLAAPEPAPLEMDGQAILLFRADFLGHSPGERAMAARRRLLTFLGMYGYDSISVRMLPQGAAVQVHGETMFVVTPGDINDLPGATMMSTADKAARLLAQRKPSPPFLSGEWQRYAVWAGSGVAGLALGLLAWKARKLRQPKPLRCPECDNADAGLLRETVDTSHFWGMRKFYCDACGYKWIKKGLS
jgi:hypothetical protein